MAGRTAWCPHARTVALVVDVRRCPGLRQSFFANGAGDATWSACFVRSLLLRCTTSCGLRQPHGSTVVGVSRAEATDERVRASITAQPLGVTPSTGTADFLGRLCRAAVDTLPATGAAVSLMTGQGSFVVAAASDPATALLADLQFTLGEGPCLDAYATGAPVLVPDLAVDGLARWPGYAAAAHEHGIGAVFAFPLQVGAARLGTLDVFDEKPFTLAASGLSLALTFADVATSAVLDGQAGAAPGHIPAGFDDALESQLHVHQAQGMVMIQLGVSLAEALARLRAHAYAHDRRLTDVANDVVERRLTLARDIP